MARNKEHEKREHPSGGGRPDEERRDRDLQPGQSPRKPMPAKDEQRERPRRDEPQLPQSSDEPL